MAKTKRGTQARIEDIFVSVVTVIDSDSSDLSSYIKRLHEVLHTTYTNYEIVVVDNSASPKQISDVTSLLQKIPGIRIIKLSQKFKYDTALFAGLEVSIGDYVCTMNAELDPVKEIPRLVAKNKHNDVIQGVSKVPIHNIFGVRLGRRLFYWYNRKYLGVDIPINATYLISFTRRSINSLTSFSPAQRYLRHLARRIGYGYTTHEYKPIGNPSNQRTLRTSISEAFEIVTSYSTHPLRFVTKLGVVAGLINVLYAGYVLVVNIFNPNVAQGWTSTSMQLSLMFFILFTIMVVLSEYIGRILNEKHKEASYFIADELVSSSAIIDADRRNISK